MTRDAPSADGRWISRTFIIAVWFGLGSGLIEVAAYAIKRMVQHRMIGVSRDVIWMSPLADIAFCLIAASVLVVVAGRVHRLRSLAAAVSVTAFPAALTVILHYQPIHILAKVTLALGIAVALGRTAAARPGFFASLIGLTSASFRRRTGSDRPAAPASELPVVDRRRFVTATAVTLGGLLLGTRGALQVGEWRTLGALPSPPANAPNILLIVLDTVRAASMSLYGYGRRTTPELERWAARGVTFDNAYSTAPWTLPSHASMFTGHWPHEMSTDWDSPLDDRQTTLAGFLDSKGYATAGFTANPAYTTWESGLDRGFAHYDDYPETASLVLGSSRLGSLLGCGTRNEVGCRLRGPLGWYQLLDGKPASTVTREFTRWLDGQSGDRPFFAFLNMFDGHVPYLPPAPFDTQFAPASERDNPMHLDLPGWEWTPERVQAEQDAYDGAIAYLDSQVAALLDDLERRGILDNTLVIITSDHGEEFQEHGVMTHGNSLYIPALHVPLVLIAGARVPAGLRVADPVSVRDLAATICDIAGFDDAPFPGHRLAGHWRLDGVKPEPLYAQVSERTFRPSNYPVSKGDMHSIIAGRHHYIRGGDGVIELYDLQADPWEMTDVSSRERLVTDSLRVLMDPVIATGK